MKTELEQQRREDAKGMQVWPVPAAKPAAKAKATLALPDSDLIVLAFIEGGMADEDGLPLWPAWHDGECWRHGKDGDVVQGKVIGWMEIHEAHRILVQSQEFRVENGERSATR